MVDGNWVFAAGAMAGIDAALWLAADLRGVEAAQSIQLYMVYAPEAPLNSGTAGGRQNAFYARADC